MRTLGMGGLRGRERWTRQGGAGTPGRQAIGPDRARSSTEGHMCAFGDVNLIGIWVLPNFRCSWSRARAVIRLEKKEVRGRLLACCRFVIGAAYESAKARHLKALP